MAGQAANQLGVSMSQPLTAHEGYYDIPELQADVADKVFTENEKNAEEGCAGGSGADHLCGLRRSVFPGGVFADGAERPAS